MLQLTISRENSSISLKLDEENLVHDITETTVHGPGSISVGRPFGINLDIVGKYIVGYIRKGSEGLIPDSFTTKPSLGYHLVIADRKNLDTKLGPISKIDNLND